MSRCRQILTEHKEQLTLIAETLLEVETLDREQIEGLFYNGKLPERNYDEEDHDVVDDNDEKAGASYEEVKEKISHHDEETPEDEPEERPDMVEDNEDEVDRELKDNEDPNRNIDR